ncbi:hypothetical protein J6590_059190 [Homalodisca vitripennis]|nr:hypothetical protein J6590_059190 [Homalodisca vitripennis]
MECSLASTERNVRKRNGGDAARGRSVPPSPYTLSVARAQLRGTPMSCRLVCSQSVSPASTTSVSLSEEVEETRLVDEASRPRPTLSLSLAHSSVGLLCHVD